jgi:hypothetical protein
MLSQHAGLILSSTGATTVGALRPAELANISSCCDWGCGAAKSLHVDLEASLPG